MADFSYDYSICFEDALMGATISFHCFDTANNITAYSQTLERSELEDLLLRVRGICIEFHRMWSFSLVGSDVERINRCSASCDVDLRTAQLLESMLTFHAHEPLLDPTMGAVSLLWKDARHIPDTIRVSRAMAHVGAEKVYIEGRTIVKSDPEVNIDFGAAAKGFVADEIALFLRNAGVESAKIDLGGNVLLLGSHPEGRPWSLEVHIPDGVEIAPLRFRMTDAAAVTSGTYERFIETDGKRYHHIIDPRTGWPADTDIISATVFHSSSLVADMLSTCILITGSAEFEALALRHPDARFVAILNTGEVLSSFQSR